MSTQMPPASTNVREFGALGDGITDDTAALQRAFDIALGTEDRSVHLPAGTYLVSAPLLYGDGLRITGEGAEVTTLRNTTTRTNGTVMLAPARPGVRDVRFQSIGLDQRANWYDRDGESRYSPLFDVTSTIGATIEDMAFRNVRTIAVYADSAASQPTVGLQVLRNHIFESNGGGISLFGAMRDIDIHGNVVEDTKDDGIALQDHGVGDFPTDARITNNIVRDCVSRAVFGSTPRGIMIFGADYVTVERNTVSRVFASGVMVSSGVNRRASHVAVLNNAVSGAGTNNDTTDVPAFGIFVLASDDVVLAGNHVTGSADRDYTVRESTNVKGP